MIALKQVFFDAFKLNEHGIHILCVGYSAKSCSGSHSSLHPYHRPSLIFRPSRHPSSEGPNIFYQKYPQSSQQKKKKKKGKSSRKVYSTVQDRWVKGIVISLALHCG